MCAAVDWDQLKVASLTLPEKPRESREGSQTGSSNSSSSSVFSILLAGYQLLPSVPATSHIQLFFLSPEIEQADSPKALALHREWNKWDFSCL